MAQKNLLKPKFVWKLVWYPWEQVANSYWKLPIISLILVGRMIKVIMTHKIRTSHDSAESSVLHQSAQKHLSNITEPSVAAIKATTKGNKIRMDVAKAVEFACILCRSRIMKNVSASKWKLPIHLAADWAWPAALQFLPGCRLQALTCFQIRAWRDHFQKLKKSTCTLFRFYHFTGSVQQLAKATGSSICSTEVGQWT